MNLISGNKATRSNEQACVHHSLLSSDDDSGAGADAGASCRDTERDGLLAEGEGSSSEADVDWIRCDACDGSCVTATLAAVPAASLSWRSIEIASQRCESQPRLEQLPDAQRTAGKIGVEKE